MGRVSTYLNFEGQAEEAFAAYAAVFGTELLGLQRYRDLAGQPGWSEVPEADAGKVLHAALPILGGHLLMATDMLGSMGQHRRIGNSTTICLEPDSREEADRIYAALSDGATEAQPMGDMPWGAYWGVCLDRFGTRWMINVAG